MLEIPGGVRVRVRWVIVHPTSYIQINTPTDRSVIIIFCLIYVCIVFPVFVICCYTQLDILSPIHTTLTQLAVICHLLTCMTPGFEPITVLDIIS